MRYRKQLEREAGGTVGRLNMPDSGSSEQSHRNQELELSPVFDAIDHAGTCGDESSRSIRTSEIDEQVSPELIYWSAKDAYSFPLEAAQHTD
jgi:hypothetical protein